MASTSHSNGDKYEASDYASSDSLLHSSEVEDASELIRRHRRRSICGTWMKFLMLQIVLISVYTAIFLSLNKSSRRDDLVYSPAADAVRYERVRFNATLIIESIYNGPPSVEVDAAWSALLDNMNIAVPKSDLEKIGTTSIPIPDSNNMYFAGLSVFHELHCLKRLRQYTWKEHYFPNMTAEDEALNRLHTDHCLEILRQASLCHADTSLFTLEWSEDSIEPRADFSQEHQCVDFDALNKWAGERRVDAGKPGILVHPFRGASYPEGKGNKIGASLDTSATVTEG